MLFWKECDVPVQEEVRVWREAFCAYVLRLDVEVGHRVDQAAQVADGAVLKFRERIQPAAFDSRLPGQKKES